MRVPACRTKTWENMKVLANNCVSKIEIPEGVNYSGNGVAYNPVLGLFVTVVATRESLCGILLVEN